MVFHDCTRVFVVNGTLPDDLLPDGLHPSLEGERPHMRSRFPLFIEHDGPGHSASIAWPPRVPSWAHGRLAPLLPNP